MRQDFQTSQLSSLQPTNVSPMLLRFLLTVNVITGIGKTGTIFPVKLCLSRLDGYNDSMETEDSDAHHSVLSRPTFTDNTGLFDKRSDGPEGLYSNYCRDMMDFLPIHFTKHPKQIFKVKFDLISF